LNDWQRKADVGNRVAVGVQYEAERHRRSVASMTVVCKDCQVQTGNWRFPFISVEMKQVFAVTMIMSVHLC